MSLPHSGGHGVLDCLESHTVLKQQILIAYQGFTGLSQGHNLCVPGAHARLYLPDKLGHNFSNLRIRNPSMILNFVSEHQSFLFPFHL
jgi:hypothetical protein